MDEIHDRADAGSPANGVAIPERADGSIGEHTKAHPGSANLRPPWPKGVSGNPGGRPKGTSLPALIEDLLEQDEIGGKKLPGGKQIKNLLAEALVKPALKGDIRHLQEILNRIYGRVSERVEIDARISIEATLARLSDQELDVYEQLTRKLVGDDDSEG